MPNSYIDWMTQQRLWQRILHKASLVWETVVLLLMRSPNLALIMLNPRPERLIDKTSGATLGIQENDLWIAAIAVEYNMRLVSDDKMKHIQEAWPTLKVIPWKKTSTSLPWNRETNQLLSSQFTASPPSCFWNKKSICFLSRVLFALLKKCLEYVLCRLAPLMIISFEPKGERRHIPERNISTPKYEGTI